MPAPAPGPVIHAAGPAQNLAPGADLIAAAVQGAAAAQGAVQQLGNAAGEACLHANIRAFPRQGIAFAYCCTPPAGSLEKLGRDVNPMESINSTIQERLLMFCKALQLSRGAWGLASS